MKKLMVMLAAAASAVSLFAEVRANGTSFEGSPTGSTIAEQLASVDTAGAWTFTEASATNVTIKGYGSEPKYSTSVRPQQFIDNPTDQYNYLALETGANAATREISGGFAFNSANVFVDTLVKFTAYEDAPAVDANAKIAVWLKEIVDPDDEDKSTTNIFVTAYDGTSSLTNYNCGTVDAEFVGAWHRLTIKAIPDVTSDGSQKVGFVVYIDRGEKILFALDGVELGGLSLNANAAAYAKEDQLFLANGNTALSKITVSGTGAIDDISFTDQTPTFAKDFEFVNVIGNDNVDSFFVEDAKWTKGGQPLNFLADGSQITATGIVYSAGYYGVTSQDKELTAGADIKVGEAKVASFVVEDTDGKKHYYDTLLEAVTAAAGWGMPVALAKDYTGNLTINAATTLDLGGYTLTGLVTYSAALTITDSSLGKTGRIVLTGGAQYENPVVTYDEQTTEAQLTLLGGIYDGLIATSGLEPVIKGGVFYDNSEAEDERTFPYKGANTWTEADEKTYEATWSANYWTVVEKQVTTVTATFVSDSVTVDTQVIESGTAPTNVVVTKTGYAFAGWNPVIGNITEDTTYTAQWTKLGFAIIIAGQGGTATTNYYADFAAALTAASAGQTITVMDAASIPADTVVDKAINIALNGQTLSLATATIGANVGVSGAGTLNCSGDMTVNATLDLSALNYAQVPQKGSGYYFVIGASGKVIMPIGPSYPEMTLAVKTASSADGAKIATSTGTTYTWGNGVWAQGETIAVAKIGNVGYATLADALAAAEAGQTVTLLAAADGVTGADIANLAADITIDLNGKQMTLDNGAVALNYNVTFANTGVGGGLLNEAQITIAANKKLDLSAFTWGNGLIPSTLGTETTARFTIQKDAELALGADAVAPTAYQTAGFLTAVDGAKYTAAGVTYTKFVDAWSSETAVATVDAVEYADLHNALVAATAGQTVKLLRDVNLSGKAWTPVSNFVGTFDGNNKTISGLTINATVNRVAFFNTPNAVIKNVTFTQASVTTTGRYAAVVAIEPGGTISNVTITASTVSANSYAAIVGSYLNTTYNPVLVDITVTGCTLVGDKAGKKFGIIADYMCKGSLKRCTVSGNTFSTGTAKYVGALVGQVNNQYEFIYEDMVVNQSSVPLFGALNKIDYNTILRGSNTAITSSQLVTEDIVDVNAKDGPDVSYKGALVIEAGTFTLGTKFVPAPTEYMTGTLAIKGGTYNLDPKNYVAEGYKVTGTGPWTVVAKEQYDLTVTCPAQAIISNLTAEAVLVSGKVYEGDDIVFNVTVTDSTKVLDTVTVNGAAATPVEGVYTVENVQAAVAIVVTVKDAAQPVPPGGQDYPTPQAATNAAEAINTAATPEAKAALIADPVANISAADKQTYAGYVKAEVNGNNVKLVLNEQGETVLTNQITTAVKAFNVSAVAGGTASTATVTSPVVGMWYNMVHGTAVGALTQGGTGIQATGSNTVSFQMTKTAAATAEFYTIKAGVTQAEVAPDAAK